MSEIEEGNVEFFATMQSQAKDALVYLKALRNWMQRYEINPTIHAKNMIDLWGKKADDLFSGKPLENTVQFKPFKSLMQQLSDGDLSINKNNGTRNNKAA